jgi:acetyl/propionyl-CoA carboxylase alpha subunit
VEASASGGVLKVRLDGSELEVRFHQAGGDRICLELDGETHLVHLATGDNTGWASVDGCHLCITRAERRKAGGARALPSEVTPPMPAVVVGVMVAEGDQVKRGQNLVVVSAMKMETTLVAPRDGTVTAVRVKEGDKVMPGEILVDIREEGDAHGG